MADPLTQLLGEGPGITAVREQVRKLLQRQPDSRRMPNILLRGETGTGKGLVARAMHEASPRGAGPFVDVNCAAIPEKLLEAEMFGVERGAFTDAQRSRPGLFQLAHRGTIFLDEIGLLPEALQAKLLKAIEEREVRRLGGTHSEAVDVWVVAATGEDLEAAVGAGRFRADLYYRLAVVTLVLPPLRERGQDVLLLAEHFLARACRDYGLPVKTLTPAARAAILAYEWPGNVRELSNALERVALLSDAIEVTTDVLALPQDVPPEPRVERAAGPALQVALDSTERQRLLEALNETGWNITRAAARLSVSRNTLRYRIEKHGLRPATTSPATRGPATARRMEAVADDTPPTAPPATGQRERRRLTLLRAALVVPPGPDEPPQIGRALDLLSDKGRSFGGRIEELSATGIVAVFGLEPVEDAPLRAAHAAMAIVNGVERLRRARATNATVKLAIHVDQFSIAPGTLSPIDLEARLHVWAFLESLLSPLRGDGIVASEAAVPFLERRFDLASEPVLEGSPWRARRVLARTSTGFAPGGPIATFVGRQHELQMLGSRFQLVAGGQGQIVGIAGEAGIGKSRLLFEFRQVLAGHAVFLEGHCHSYGSAIPYLPVLDMLRGLCRLVEADTPEAGADKVRATLAELGLEAPEHAPYVLHLLGLKDGARLLGARSPEEIKARIFDTLNKVLLRASAHQPLVVLVEDLHWIDPTSEEYLAALAVRLAGAPVMLVATYRSGYRATWIDRSYAMQIALQPLDPQHAGSVVRGILGPRDVADSLVEQIVSRAEGNPFFLEELARAVREQGGAPALLVPDTVHEVLLARINRLPSEEKTLLQIAAVIGKDVSLPLLRAIAALPEAQFRQHLTHLKAAEFLVEDSRTPELYTFKHALTHDVAYEAFAPDRRRALHAGIVQAIEATSPDRVLQHVDVLARHAFHGEVWDKALVYQRQAGVKAASRSAHSEAVIYFARALVALEQLPEGRERTEQAVDLHLSRANSFIPIAELGPIADHLREADRLARTIGDQTRVGRVASFLSAYYWLTGDHEAAVEQGRRALDIVSELGDLGLRVRTNLSLGQAYHVLGDYRQASERLGRNVEDLQGELLGRRFGLVGLASVLSRAWLVWCLTELGEFDRASARGEEAIRIAETVGDPYSIIASYFAVGGLHLRRGELPRAIEVLERALNLCRTWDTQLRLWFAGVAPTLGHAYALSGRAAEAIPLLEQAIEQAAAMKLMFAQPLRLGWLAHACLHAGRVADARRLAPQALELARRHRERGHEVWIHGIIGEIAAQQDPPDPDRAEHAYREAIRIGEELGMRPRVAVAHLGLARLHRRAGKGTQAADHLAIAIASLEALQMPLWLDQARGEPTTS